MTDVGGGSTRTLTDGAALDTHPRPSPDGAWIAFLRLSPESGAAHTAALPRHAPTGGRARRTRLRHGVADIVWSPDGTRISFTTRMLPGQPFPILGEEERSNDPYLRFNEDVLVTSRRKWKADGAGFLGEERRRGPGFGDRRGRG
ncbi:MAG: hypothetical protein R2873_16405 [Caldilineaceae bacterium]